MSDKNHKVNNKEIIALIMILIAIILGVIIYQVKTKEFKKSEPYPNTTEETTETQQKTTEEMKDKVPLIDMNNKENVQIKNGEKVNISEEIEKEREISGLKITDIQLRTKSGVSNFTATVENASGEDFAGRVVVLKFKKSDGSSLADVEAWIPAIKAGETNTINASTTIDVVNASDVEIELTK